MYFLLEEILDGNPYQLGIIKADNLEQAAEKVGRKPEGTGAGPRGNHYCQLSPPVDKTIQKYPFLIMVSLPAIDSVEDLVALATKQQEESVC